MHTLTLPLKTTKYDRQIMIKRFYAASKVHNTIVKHARKLLIQLVHDKEYQELRDSYIRLNDPDRKLSKDEEKLKKSLMVKHLKRSAILVKEVWESILVFLR